MQRTNDPSGRACHLHTDDAFQRTTDYPVYKRMADECGLTSPISSVPGTTSRTLFLLAASNSTEGRGPASVGICRALSRSAIIKIISGVPIAAWGG